MRKISIIIPAYNEERTILALLKKVQIAPVSGLEKEIIVVDNNSKDKTYDLALSTGVKVFKETNKG